MITFACTSCGQALNVREEFARKPCKCPRCGQVQPVPPPAPVGEIASIHPATRSLARPAANVAELPTLPPGSSGNVRVAPDSDTLPPRAPFPSGTSAGKGSSAGLAATTVEVPGHEILAELGRGGMGVVYKARHTQLKRLVALKMILAGGHASEQALARFRIEAEAVARIQHPGIVQIYEVGEHNGLPFFSLEFCPGGSLAGKLHGTPLPARAAAQLVEKLARAMAAAHAQGIVHRDLKPANVLLDAEGEPKITDFGLAKKLDDDQGQTASGAIMGTPSYMAPEQAGGESKTIGPAADVYALGAILYELLTGRSPFKGATAMETLLQVVAEEPIAPSRLQRSVPLDLETICLKCLEKNPRRRYASSEALAEELRRYRAGEPIQARPLGVWRRGLKWAWRKPAAAALLLVSVAAALTMLVGGLRFTYQLREKTRLAQEERDRVVEQEQQTQRERDKAQKERDGAEAARTTARKERDRAEEELVKAQWNLFTAQLARVHAVHDNDPLRGLALLNDTDVCPLAWRDAAWGAYYHLCCGDKPRLLKGHLQAVTSVAISPDSKVLASGSDDGTVRLWDLSTGLGLATLKGHTRAPTSVAFSPDCKLLASGSQDMTVRLWDVATGEARATLKGHTARVASVAFSPDSMVLASGSRDNTVRLWEVATGRERAVFQGDSNSVNSISFSPDGKLLASGSQDMMVRLWDVATGQARATLKGHTARVASVAFGPDGKVLASGSLDGTVRLWEASTGAERAVLQGHTGGITSVAFSPDGKVLASGSGRNARVKSATQAEVKLWDVRTGQERASLRAFTAWITSVAFSPDGKFLASGNPNRLVRLWDVRTTLERVTLKVHANPVQAVAFSPDSKLLASGSRDKTVRLWEVSTGRERALLEGHTGGITSVAFSPDGKLLASGSHDKSVRLWEVSTGRDHALLQGHAGSVTSVSFSPDGKLLASGSSVLNQVRNMQGGLKLWEVSTGAERPLFKGPMSRITSVAFSPDGKLLASGSQDAIRLWEVNTGRERALLKGHVGRITSVAFSPDGKLLASGSTFHGKSRTMLGELKLWKMGTDLEHPLLPRYNRPVASVAFRPDGKLLALASNNGAVILWDVRAGKMCATLKGHSETVNSVAFSPDGTMLASGSADGTVKVWNVVGIASRN